MLNNWRIGRPFGIDVFVSGWFWILPLVVFVTSFADGLDAALFNTASLLALFGCVGLHELGHALAARGYGIRTRDITLYPIGGVARLERMPEKPLAEVAIALAGPAVNVVIALLLGAVWVGGQYALGSAFRGGVPGQFVERLMLGNAALAVFNLIPAFPMDGGRVLRAFLSWFTTRSTATNVASWVGSGFAVLFGLYGLVSFNPFLVVLAVSVFMMGRQEVAAVRQQEQWKRRQAMEDDPQDDWPDRRGRGGHTGWVHYADTGEWVEYRDGWPVRRFRDR